MAQHEIVEHSALLNPDGSLAQKGWARRPVLDCNLERTRIYRFARGMQWFRVKRWDYYGVTYPGGYFSATIADLGYAGQAFVYMVDFQNATCVEDTITIPFGKGVQLPRNSDEGVSSWSGKKASLRFDVSTKGRTLAVEWDGFGGKHLHADLAFETPRESTVLSTPIGERRFYYNRKINCMPPRGEIVDEFRDARLGTWRLGVQLVLGLGKRIRVHDKWSPGWSQHGLRIRGHFVRYREHAHR